MYEWYQTFGILAEEKSFTQTAKRLFCSQPTVSQHIQQLENTLNCQLIIRNKRQIQLTAQGEIVLQYIKKIKNLEQEMQNELQQTVQKNMPVYIGQYIATHFFSELFEQQPLCTSAIKYDIMSYCYKELKQFLDEQKTKFVIMPIYDGDISLKNYEIEVLFEEELVLTMHKSHPLAERQVVYARDLKRETIYLTSSHYLKELIVQGLAAKNVDAYFVQMTNFGLIKKAMLQTGCAFLPKRVVADDKDYVNKPIKGFKLSRKIGIIYNKDAVLTEEEQLFCMRAKQRLTQTIDV